MLGRSLYLTAIASFALVAATASATDITPATLTMVGSAGANGSSLQLTDGSGGEAGAGWLATPISTSTSFSATFSFSLQEGSYGLDQADGIAFVVQDQGTGAVGDGGGDIGVVAVSSGPAIASVFQTWDNDRIGFTTDQNPYDAPGAGENLGGASSILGTTTVTYNAGTQLWTTNTSYTLDGTPYAASDSVTWDLTQEGSEAFLGFTGGTGASDSIQDITSFSLTETPEPSSLLLFGTGLAGLVGTLRRRLA